jgi:hypothetical protein
VLLQSGNHVGELPWTAVKLSVSRVVIVLKENVGIDMRLCPDTEVGLLDFRYGMRSCVGARFRLLELERKIRG